MIARVAYYVPAHLLAAIHRRRRRVGSSALIRPPKDDHGASPVSSFGSGTEGSDGRTISRSRQADGTRRQGDHGDRVARHIEELYRVAFLADTRDDMALHDSADIAGT